MNAEQAILGTMIKHNHFITDTILRADHFEQVQHKKLFKTMLALVSRKRPVDKITLSTLTNINELGGISYINELASYANAERFDEYETIVIEAWKEREKRNVLNQAIDGDWDIHKIIDKLNRLNESKIDDYRPIKDELAEMFEAPFVKKETKMGVSTGIKTLNRVTGGFQSGELTIVAARPSMGKTDTMLHFAKQAGWTKHLPIIFSLEMPARSLTNRLIASTGGYNRSKMRDPYHTLTDEQKKKWSDVIGRLSQTNMQIFDGAGQSIPEMRAKIRKLIHEFNGMKPVVFIDYLTLIRPNAFYNGSAHLQVTEISRNLKGMAKEFDCPVICLAQLSRAVEQRQNKRPQMSDIRESGSVEQDADLIIFLYRDKYYEKNDDDTLELIVAKNRNGPIGTVSVTYNEHTGEIIDES